MAAPATGIKGAIMKLLDKIINTKGNRLDVRQGEARVREAERITMKLLEIRRDNLKRQTPQEQRSSK